MAKLEGHELSKNRRTFLKISSAGAIAATAGCLGGSDGDTSGDSTDGGVAGNADEDVPTLSLGWQPAGALIGSTAKMILSDEIHEEIVPNPLGEEYELETTGVDGTNEIVNAVAAGEIDGGLVPVSSLSPAVAEGALTSDDISIVWPECIFGPDAGHSDNYAAAADSGITGWDDIPGSTFAINVFGSGSDISARIGMEDHGIDPEEDVEMVQIPFQDQPAAMEEGRIEIGTFLQPFYEEAREMVGGLNFLYDFSYPFGNLNMFNMVLTNEILEEEPDAVAAFAENSWETAKFEAGLDDYDQDRAIEILANELDISEERSELLLTEVADEDYPSPAGRRIGYYTTHRGRRQQAEHINPAADALADAGAIEESIDYSDFITNDIYPEEADELPEPMR